MSEPAVDPEPAVPSAEIEAEARRIVAAATAQRAPGPADGRPGDPDPVTERRATALRARVPGLRPRRPRPRRGVVPAAARGGGVRRRQAVQRDPRRPAARLHRPGRALGGRRRHRSAGDVPHDRAARSAGDRRPDPRPGRPAPDQGPDLGDEPEGPRRRRLPPGRPPAGRRRTARGGRGTPTGHAGPIDLVRIRSVLGADWGLCHTAERNLRAIAALVAETRRSRTRPTRSGTRSPRSSPTSRRPRSRSAGRPGPGSASASAGTRPPRRPAAQDAGRPGR